jgi:Tfp pilus assembly protein PilF
MHSVFRIGQVKKIGKNDRLWQVDLTLTRDNDLQLHALTERMREETFSGYKGWYRLGYLMIKLGYFNKAEQLYEILLEQTTEEGERANIYHMLGIVKDQEEKYTEAIEFYEKSIKINQKILSPTHSSLAGSYTNLGLAYNKMGEYTKALSSQEKALQIYQKILPKNHPYFATSYTCHGSVYNKMGEYSKALSYHIKALQIYQKTLPENHPDLATSYTWHGYLYDKLGDYSKALSYYECAVNIQQRSLPPNHPHLQSVRTTINLVKKKFFKE